MKKKNYNIFCNDGGGIKGVNSLVQIREFEKILGCKIKDYFHLLGGTSTGGIVVVMLALGYSCDEILKIYTEHGDEIFHKQFLRYGWLRPKYDDTNFNNLIKSYVGDKKLSDLEIDIIIPAYNATKQEMYFFKSRKAKLDSKYDFSLFDVVRSTSSAPTFFKPHVINGEVFRSSTDKELNKACMVDGGLGVNNPSMICFSDTKENFVDYKDEFSVYNKINLISFGTGEDEIKINKKVIKGGKLMWAAPTVEVLMRENNRMTNISLKKLFKSEKGIYTRCQSIIKNSTGDIDDASRENINNMISDGMNSVKTNRTIMLDFNINTIN